MAFNLFANIDKFNDDANYSFGELDDNVDDITELPEETVAKTVTKSRRGRTKTKSTKKAKPDCDELVVSDNDDVNESPGVGQKTAYKKLSKLKESLAATAATISTRKRSTISSAIQEAIQQKRSRRARATETAEIQFEHSSAVDVKSKLMNQANTLNDSFDDEDLKINVKLKWEGTTKIEKIEFSMYKTFNELIGELSAREKVEKKLFLLMLGNAVIKPDDSPYSIGYTLGKFISVRIVDDSYSYITESASTSQRNTIEVKIQSPQWKKPMIYNIKLTDQFQILCFMCSEKLKCHPNKIRFKFDGDIISKSSTPAEHDFDGGEILHLLLSD